MQNQRQGTRSDWDYGIRTAPGRINGMEKMATKATCICMRPRYNVMMCLCCGIVLKKCRVRTPCPVHPSVVFYSDLTECPNCREAAGNNLLPIED